MGAGVVGRVHDILYLVCRFMLVHSDQSLGKATENLFVFGLFGACKCLMYYFPPTVFGLL